MTGNEYFPIPGTSVMQGSGIFVAVEQKVALSFLSNIYRMSAYREPFVAVRNSLNQSLIIII